MKIAVVKTGGKQYKVSPNDIIKVEKLAGKEGDGVELDQILLTADEEAKKVDVGTPILEGKKIKATILEQGKAKKVNVVKYKPKVRYKKKTGHRQEYTKLQIQSF